MRDNTTKSLSSIGPGAQRHMAVCVSDVRLWSLQAGSPRSSAATVILGELQVQHPHTRQGRHEVPRFTYTALKTCFDHECRAFTQQPSVVIVKQPHLVSLKQQPHHQNHHSLGLVNALQSEYNAFGYKM